MLCDLQRNHGNPNDQPPPRLGLQYDQFVNMINSQPHYL